MRSARVGGALLALSFVASLGAVACGGDAAASGGLATVFDSTRADTVIATTVGRVPPSALRHLVEEMRIAPSADDTTLFGDTYEFDVGRDGRLYVHDESGNAIFLFDASGALVRRIGRKGGGPGEIEGNGGMVVLPDGRLAVWDTGNGRVSFFSAAGDFIEQWKVPHDYATRMALHADRTGTLRWRRPVADERPGDVVGRTGLVTLRAGGAMSDSILPPDLPIEPITYVAEYRDGTVLRSRSSASPLHSPLALWGWHPDGHFVSIASSRYRVESSRTGLALRIVRDAPVIPIPDGEREWNREMILFQMLQTQPSWTWNGPPLPTEKAPVAGLDLARDGRIWVLVATPSEEIPVAEREEQRPNSYPVQRYRQPTEYEVFEKDGRFLGRVSFPPRAQWMEADGTTVWYLQRDEDGLPAVVRARIEPALR